MGRDRRSRRRRRHLLMPPGTAEQVPLGWGSSGARPPATMLLGTRRGIVLLSPSDGVPAGPPEQLVVGWQQHPRADGLRGMPTLPSRSGPERYRGWLDRDWVWSPSAFCP